MEIEKKNLIHNLYEFQVLRQRYFLLLLVYSMNEYYSHLAVN